MKELIEILTFLVVVFKFYLDLNEKYDDLKMLLIIQQAKINQIIESGNLEISKLDLKDLRDN